jgi:hypothetical protein
MNLPAEFAGEEVIVDRILFEHGYGFSSYYPCCFGRGCVFVSTCCIDSIETSFCACYVVIF